MKLKLKHISTIIVCFLGLFPTAHATMTLIQGNAFYYRGKSIEIRQYSDLFTFQSSVLAKASIPADGSFKFEIDVEKTGLYLISIGKVKAHLFVEPGNQYTLVLPEPLDNDKYNPARDVFIHPEVFESDGKLNYNITAVERTINKFLDENAHHYGRGVNRKIIPLTDSLMASLSETYREHDNAYFEEYLHFRFATLALQTNQSRNKVFETYFMSHEPAYEQLSFANAFSLFFEEYFSYLNPKADERFQVIADSAISSTNYQLLIECMALDPYLKELKFRELLAATQLYELGAERKYAMDKINPLLDSLMLNAQDTECKTIASNAQQLLNHLAPGTLAPELEFMDIVGNIYRLSEYKGRYIYIQFFDEFNAETLKEMSLMKVLKDGYGSDIAMFSITTAESLERLKSFSKKYDFRWYFGKAHDAEAAISAFELRAMPTYFYLDKDLKIIKSPAPPPGAKIEKLFAKAWNAEHPNKTLHFKLQPPEVSPEDDAEKSD